MRAVPFNFIVDILATKPNGLTFEYHVSRFQPQITHAQSLSSTNARVASLVPKHRPGAVAFAIVGCRMQPYSAAGGWDVLVRSQLLSCSIPHEKADAHTFQLRALRTSTL
jgi:hypothetical protein